MASFDEEGDGKACTSRWTGGGSVKGGEDVGGRPGERRNGTHGKGTEDAQLLVEIRERILHRMRGCENIAKRCMEQARRNRPKKCQRMGSSYPLQKGKVISRTRAFQTVPKKTTRAWQNQRRSEGRNNTEFREANGPPVSPNSLSTCRTPIAPRSGQAANEDVVTTKKHDRDWTDLDYDPVESSKQYNKYFHLLFYTLLQGTRASQRSLLDYRDKDICVHDIRRVDVEAESPIQDKPNQSIAAPKPHKYHPHEYAVSTPIDRQEEHSFDFGDLGLSFSCSLQRTTATSESELALTTTSSKQITFLEASSSRSPSVLGHFLD
eukprot:scaffold131_cov335-Pavlova_lutheri.AAC.2